ncbi:MULTISPECIES: hypothetical protein [unclassified Streptomyces]|uniref:hypothetical protein n=1 Tax=unclassified Streptomyces TaxID=2593676 RepID=UPI002256131E|nr:MULTISPECIES: hypothetical protein [unclassified Streptomyces]MCX5331022.1 hypothetical protein [Streptomyces sp. NBC_00140]MCX5360416.1 hypothetical protein [Streptomyces sp. NBC_00124]
MITRPDDDPDLDPDDPLTILLRPPADHLGPPAGRYEAIRRGATRRKLLRAAAGTAVVCGLAAAVLLPLRLSTSEAPATPTVPLAPPPASSSPTAPPSTLPPSDGQPSAVPSAPATSVPVSPDTPSASPSTAPTATAEPTPTAQPPTEQP